MKDFHEKIIDRFVLDEGSPQENRSWEEIKKVLNKAQNTIHNSDYSTLKRFHDIISQQKDLDPELQQILNDNFWEMF